MHPSLPLLSVLLWAPLLAGSPPEVKAPCAGSGSTYFKDLSETRGFTSGMPVHATLTPDGKSVLFLRSGPRDTRLCLFEMDLATGRARELLSPETLLKGAAEKLSPEEKARRERMRETRSGITSFQLSRDGKRVLLGLSGRSYVVDRASGEVVELPGSGWIDPRFSPDGTRVAAVRAGDLHVLEVATGTDHAVTTGATETLTRGLAEFAAQEELDRYTGYWWAPDSKRLLFEEADTSSVERLHFPNLSDPFSSPEVSRYPRAGRNNAKVRLGIVEATGGPVRWVRWDPERYPYLVRVKWTGTAPLTLQLLTRDQREMTLLKVDPADGATTGLLTEKDPAWVSFEGVGGVPHWLPDGSAFLWITDRLGSRQLELHGANGAFQRALTPQGFEVTGVEDVDASSRTLVLSGGADARERHLFRLSLDGGAPVQLSRGAGRHTGDFAQNHAAWIDRFNLMDGSLGARVCDASGRILAQLPSIAEKPPFLPSLELPTVGGTRTFDTYLVRPRDFKPGRKYPVILNVYAGPSTKVVRATPRAYMHDQWQADQGFIVVGLDGRGTPGHGRAWERAIKGNLIDAALEDQIAGLRLLAGKFPEMDLNRVGVTGASFGGYFTAMATIRRPDVFRCGVAISPVTDWRDYDTAYTERYLDLPSANPEGYAASNVMTYADQLSRPLFIIHGLTDDNVLILHSLKLMDALLRAGRPFEFLPMTGTHLAGSEDPLLAMREAERVMAFLKRNLLD